MPLYHILQQRVAGLPLTGEVQRRSLDPALLRCIDRRAATAGVVDQDIDFARRGQRRFAQARRGVLCHQVLSAQRRPLATRRDDFVGLCRQQPGATRHHGNVHAFRC